MLFKQSWQYLERRLYRRVDGASLAVFRIAFGALMLWDVWKYFRYDWIGMMFITPRFHFTYYGFGWVEPWPGNLMYVHFAVLGLLAILIMVGLFYRVAIVLFLVAFTYVFLLDQAEYLNHFYLVILLNILMVFVPANRVYALDSLIWRRVKRHQGQLYVWNVWIVRVQMEIVLIFAGIVKINPDWLQLQPLKMWQGERSHVVLIGPYLNETWVIAVGAYGVILLHVLGAPLLLHKRTRLPVFGVYALFHLANHVFFNIGIFPWLTLAGTTLFFAPDWPRRWLSWGKRAVPGVHTADAKDGGVFGAKHHRLVRQSVVVLLGVWVATQILIPMRHHLYPGDTSWTEQGHRFSWQMKLRDKTTEAQFTVIDPENGQSWAVDKRFFLTARQVRKMSNRPDMILQFAHHVADQWQRERGRDRPAVHALVRTSLNGRTPQLMIDPERNLVAIERDLAPADWILPLTVELPR